MAVSVRTRVGPYEILSAVGVAGVGEGYRSRDTMTIEVKRKVPPGDTFHEWFRK